MSAPMVNDVACTPTPMSGAQSLLIKAGNGLLRRIFVSFATVTPQCTVYDNTSATGTPIIQQFVPVAGQSYEFDALFQNGCFVVIAGGTIGITVFTV